MGKSLGISANVGFVFRHHLIRHVVVSLDNVAALAIRRDSRILLMAAPANYLFSRIPH